LIIPFWKVLGPFYIFPFFTFCALYYGDGVEEAVVERVKKV